MRFDTAEPAASPGQPPKSAPTSAPAGGFVIDTETGEQIYNVVGNVYQQQRDSLPREVAGAKTRGRRLIGIGSAIFVIGFATFAAGILGFISEAARGLGAGRLTRTPFGLLIFGVPSGVISWAIAVFGVLLVIVGIVRHVTATARRRRINPGHAAPGSADTVTGWVI